MSNWIKKPIQFNTSGYTSIFNVPTTNDLKSSEQYFSYMESNILTKTIFVQSGIKKINTSNIALFIPYGLNEVGLNIYFKSKNEKNIKFGMRIGNPAKITAEYTEIVGAFMLTVGGLISENRTFLMKRNYGVLNFYINATTKEHEIGNWFYINIDDIDDIYTLECNYLNTNNSKFKSFYNSLNKQDFVDLDNLNSYFVWDTNADDPTPKPNKKGITVIIDPSKVREYGAQWRLLKKT